MMTDKQVKTINTLRRALETFNYSGDYEIKRYEVEELGYGHVSFIAEVGMKGDEGTLASVICRDRVHIFIGTRGGCYYFNKKGTKKSIKPTQRISKST